MIRVCFGPRCFLGPERRSEGRSRPLACLKVNAAACAAFVLRAASVRPDDVPAGVPVPTRDDQSQASSPADVPPPEHPH